MKYLIELSNKVIGVTFKCTDKKGLEINFFKGLRFLKNNFNHFKLN